jgi:hypothetical protein
MDVAFFPFLGAGQIAEIAGLAGSDRRQQKEKKRTGPKESREHYRFSFHCVHWLDRIQFVVAYRRAQMARNPGRYDPEARYLAGFRRALQRHWSSRSGAKPTQPKKRPIAVMMA